MKVIVKTNNSFKYKEIESYLNNFGFKVIQYIDPENKNIDIIKDVEVVNELKLKNCIVIREETSLLSKNKRKLEKINHLESVIHVSELFISVFEDNKKELKDYIISETSGFIDLNKKTNNKNVYNWDDIFISDLNFKSYQEMKDIDNKFSARSKVLSIFAKKYGTFENKVDLNFNKFNQKNVVEFNEKIFELIENNQYLKLYKNNNILKGLMNTVINNGVFTRSSLNKKQRNYWYPSLNSGLPLVAKKDEIHEITFMFHDLMHQILPDCILTGENSEEHKEVYIIHRMLSEAFTLVLADMIFVNELVKIGIDYDWSKRKIYPLFKSLKLDHNNLTKDNIKSIVMANIDFALLGNKESFENLGAEKNILDIYVEKYEKFFIEDYRWTDNNYKNMLKKKSKIKNWYDFNKDLINTNNTLDYFVCLTNKTKIYEEKVWIIFEVLWGKISEQMNEILRVERNISITNAFRNYMLGQSFIFFNYKDEDHYILNLIKKELYKKELSMEDINRIRVLYKKYLDYLVEINLLSMEDNIIFSEIYPLFDAFFVNYDKDLEYKNIKDVVNNYILDRK